MVKELEPHKKHKVRKEDNELKKELSDKQAIDDACDDENVSTAVEHTQHGYDHIVVVETPTHM